MYNLFIYLYLFGVWVSSLFSEKVKKMWRGEHEAIGILKDKVDPQAQYIWFHAASLGEFEQGRPLIERIKKNYPQYKILLTFFSPSGYEVRKDYPGADIVTYLPIDTIINARRFLRSVRPVMAFFIKYEFWYNYLHILKHRHVPTYSVSSIFRPEQIFFKWYGHGYGRVLNCFTHFFVQNEESKRLLAKIGIHKVDVVGDTRFDRVLEIKAKAKVLPIVEAFVHTKAQPNTKQNPKSHPTTPQASSDATTEDNDIPVFIAGSSWPPDEEIFIPYFNKHRDWKIIIAPHVIGEDHLADILDLLKGRRVVRYTRTTPEEAALAEVLIIDCFGLLSSIYHYADVAYVGGGFGVGIHNTLEAAVWNVPVFFGPNNRKFQEAQGLKACGGGLEIYDDEEFDEKMDQLLAEPACITDLGNKAGQFVMTLAGASDKVIAATMGNQ
jgi:3-deoxy-D-manno-octulosonic-acid transferase